MIIYKHYVKADNSGRITDAWSTGPMPEKPTDGAVCINEQGEYQLRFADGIENPSLYNSSGISLYKLADGQPIARTAEEITADVAKLPAPLPSETEIMGQQLAALTLSNGQKDAIIQQLGAQVVQMQLDIAKLKGGVS